MIWTPDAVIGLVGSFFAGVAFLMFIYFMFKD